MKGPRAQALLVLMVLAFLAGTWALSQTRPIDGDEGYYVSAARLVAEGRTPYQDFFYPQMPLLPYVYAPWYGVVGNSLAGMRILSVLAGALSLWLWGSFLRRRWGDRPWLVIAGFLLVALNPFFLSWNVTVKTYALTNLAVFAAIWAMDRAGEKWVWLTLASLAAGLAVAVRAMYLPWAIVVALGLVWMTWSRGNWKPPAAVVAGALLAALLPVILLVAGGPEVFWFNNLDYHQLQSKTLGTDGPRLMISIRTVVTTFATRPSLTVTLLLAAFGLLWLRSNPGDPRRAVIQVSSVAAWVYLITCLLPSKTHYQYFAGPLTPMVVPGAVAGMAWLADRVPARKVLTAVFIVFLVAAGTFDLAAGRVGLGDRVRACWTFEHLGQVKEQIQRRSEPDDTVLAFWSGYTFESGRQYVKGLENHFAVRASVPLEPAEKRRFKVAGREVLLDNLEHKLPELVVLGAWMNDTNTFIEQRHLRAILWMLEENYELAWVLGETKILTRRP